jgi:hypothetical protein
VSDQKLPKSSQQPAPAEAGGGQLPPEPEAPAEIRALEEQLDGPAVVEGEADLSVLGDEEILLEARREIVRRRRDNRVAAKAAEAQKKAKRWVDIAVQIALVGLLVLVFVAAAVVVVVGLSEEKEGLVRIGVAALCAVGGPGFYRLSRAVWR